MDSVYLLVVEMQHPYSKDTIGAFTNSTDAETHRDRKTRENHSTHIQYLVETVSVIS